MAQLRAALFRFCQLGVLAYEKQHFVGQMGVAFLPHDVMYK